MCAGIRLLEDPMPACWFKVWHARVIDLRITKVYLGMSTFLQITPLTTFTTLKHCKATTNPTLEGGRRKIVRGGAANQGQALWLTTERG
jgi:hypothetical protein